VAPTLLKATGLDPADLPGLDLLDPAGIKTREAIFGECFAHDVADLDDPAASLRWRWVVSGRWKLIAPDPANEPAALPELYDLEADPFEEKDLSAEDPETVARLREKLDGWWPGRRESR
jgi:uncharacterized sulfatase